jgi:predicted transcriptional regulator
MKSNNLELLSRLGIHTQSVTLYCDLLEHGASQIHEISKRTLLERTLVYRRIPELLSKGLVSREISGKRYKYSANSPEILSSLLENMELSLDTVISSLSMTYNAKQSGIIPIIRVNQGMHAIDRVYEECARSLPVGGTYYRYSSRAEPSNSYEHQKKYKELRTAKNLQRLVITNQELFEISEAKPGRETVGFPSEFPFKQNFQKIIYGNFIAIIDIETRTVCTIESAMLASFERAIFLSLFGYIKKERGGRI